MHACLYMFVIIIQNSFLWHAGKIIGTLFGGIIFGIVACAACIIIFTRCKKNNEGRDPLMQDDNGAQAAANYQALDDEIQLPIGNGVDVDEPLAQHATSHEPIVCSNSAITPEAPRDDLPEQQQPCNGSTDRGGSTTTSANPLEVDSESAVYYSINI